MRKRERGEPRREHTAAAAGEEEERRGEGERESQRITRREREREREERGIDSTRHHDTTRWRRGHRQTGLTVGHVRDLADIP